MFRSDSADSERREYVTEVLDEAKWPNVLQTITRLLRYKGVDVVNAEFGFVLQRELRGEKQMEDATVPLDSLPSFIQRGLDEGTIEWAENSNFTFSPIGMDLKFMLCNDADLHFYSGDTALLLEVSRALSSLGVKVFESGKPVLTG